MGGISPALGDDPKPQLPPPVLVQAMGAKSTQKDAGQPRSAAFMAAQLQAVPIRGKAALPLSLVLPLSAAGVPVPLVLEAGKEAGRGAGLLASVFKPVENSSIAWRRGGGWPPRS